MLTSLRRQFKQGELDTKETHNLRFHPVWEFSELRTHITSQSPISVPLPRGRKTVCAKATGPGGPYFSLMVAPNEENTGDQEETHPNTAGNFLQIPRLPVTALTSTFLFYFELLQFNFDYLKKKKSYFVKCLPLIKLITQSFKGYLTNVLGYSLLERE